MPVHRLLWILGACIGGLGGIRAGHRVLGGILWGLQCRSHRGRGWPSHGPCMFHRHPFPGAPTGPVPQLAWGRPPLVMGLDNRISLSPPVSLLRECTGGRAALHQLPAIADVPSPHLTTCLRRGCSVHFGVCKSPLPPPPPPHSFSCDQRRAGRGARVGSERYGCTVMVAGV